MGYMINDNRANGGGVFEADTTHCRHCQAVLKNEEWNVYGGWCSKCAGPLCGLCAKRSYELGICEPWRKQIEDRLRAANAYRVF